ncbi:MAG TPA: T9SS type A sorting domain-containing protein [bacterium]|nr:T9SS type A sorting domain-containing protein [bacterium]HPN46189.1 T9SS type A sorting domain-containing protein [bacterium]
MKKYVMLVLLVSFFAVSSAFSQKVVGAVSWVPEDAQPGDVITLTYDPEVGIIKKFDKTVKLHWGINKVGYGKWKEPPASMWPEGTIVHTKGVSVQSPMILTAQNKWEITIATNDTIRTIDFVITNGTLWDKAPGGVDWELDLTGGGPITPTHDDTLQFEALVDMSSAISQRGFSFGDTLECQVGFFSTANEVVTVPMTRIGFTSLYTGAAEVVTTIGDTLDYQYFVQKGSQEFTELYYNFFYNGTTTGEAQRRQVIVSSPTTSVADTVASTGASDRMPFFKNLSSLSRDVLVTFTCDVRPAIAQIKYGHDILEDIQGTVDITHPDSVLAMGVAINGPATGSWSNDIGPDWGKHLMTLQNKRMYDDGTHGDAVAGDSIFTIQFQFYKDSSDVFVGQEFKFGICGGDNEGGYGNNHVENIDDSQPTAFINAQFGSIDPIFYNRWDFDKRVVTGVKPRPQTTPSAYMLEQNYPNPFNPETTIDYSLQHSGKVELSVFNVRGEKIATLIDASQGMGAYRVTWNGKDSLGNQVGSGVYFYKIKAGDFTAIKKMILVR